MSRVSKLSRNNLTTNYLNPLDIPEIVKLILSNVNNPKELKSVRTVNKLWRWESMDQLKQTAVLVLQNEVIRELINAYLNKNEEEVETGSGLKSFFHQIYEKPFYSYRAPYETNPDEPSFMSRELPLPRSSLKSVEALLWDFYLSRATYLDLGVVDLVGRCGHEGLYWLLKKCPKLKVLVVDLHVYERREVVEVDDDEEPLTVSNLESISIGKYYINDYTALIDKDYSLAVFEKLLKYCPKLKNLWTYGTGEMCPIVEAAIQARQKLESLTLVALKDDEVDLHQLAYYFLQVRPPLKSLVLKINFYEAVNTGYGPIPVLKNVLEEVSPTLSNLELYLDSDRNDRMFLQQGFQRLMRISASERKLLEIDLSFEGRVTFPSLARLKILIYYKYFDGDGTDTLLNFDFWSLKCMQKLKEFRFESGRYVEKSWVCKKITKNDLHSTGRTLLPDLKHFYFHKQFTPNALELLGKTMPSLETLEVVLDKATFPIVFKTWPDLKQVTLLPCSDVPQNLYSERRKARNGSDVLVNDQSTNYYAAQKHPRIISTMSRSKPLEMEMPCFREKAHHVINY